MKVIFDNGNERYLCETEDRNHFFFDDELKGHNEVFLHEEGIVIKRTSESHNTLVHLLDDAYIEIENKEGYFQIRAKDIAIYKNNDNIDIVYTIEEEKKKISIKYLGVNNEQQINDRRSI